MYKSFDSNVQMDIINDNYHLVHIGMYKEAVLETG